MVTEEKTPYLTAVPDWSDNQRKAESLLRYMEAEQAHEAALHDRIRDILGWAGARVPQQEGPGCRYVEGCDRPGVYWVVQNGKRPQARIYDEEGFIHAHIGSDRVVRHSEQGEAARALPRAQQDA